MKPSKYSFIQYNKPNIPDMAVLLCFFNYANSNRIVQNILTIKHYLQTANIPYFISEITYNDNQFVFEKSDNIFQFKSDSILFYKENLITTMEQLIPSNYSKILIMDSDLCFDNPDWYSIISDKLNSVKVTQPFKNAYWLDIDYTYVTTNFNLNNHTYTKKTNVLNNKISKIINHSIEHVGFIWGFDREWFKQCNFIDEFVVTGGGDTILANYITNRFNIINSVDMFYKTYLGKKMKLDNLTYDSCNLNIFHLYHGKIINRGYYDKYESIIALLKNHNILSLYSIINRRKDNILEWNPEYRTIMNEFMMNMFINRNDDE